MKVEKGYTKLTVPHEDKEITFVHPAFKGTYANVAEAIKKEGLMLPTSGQTASLVYDAFQNRVGKYEREIFRALKKNYFWEPVGNLYLPKSNDDINNGVILEDNPTIQNGKLIMDKNSLIKRLNENDSNVRFVPFGYKTGEQSSRNLEKNPYIVARYGEEGAQKIAKISSSYRFNPKLHVLNHTDKEESSLSMIHNDGYPERRLIICGIEIVGGSNSYVFGMEPKR